MDYTAKDVIRSIYSMSTVHTDADIEKTIAIADDILSKL
jgi:hypothetical protein